MDAGEVWALEAERRAGRARAWRPLLALLGAWQVAGCQSGEPVAAPAVVVQSRLRSMTVAVTPALNQSGSRDFDAARFADLMASELGYAEGLAVIPVSRVLAILAAQGADGVKSPSHALELAERLGADAILVFAVTEYDPYDPPVIGITAQLYSTRPWPPGGPMEPAALPREAGHAASPEGDPERDVASGLLAQTQRVFNASHGDVIEEVKRYAGSRAGDRSPYGWRKYVVSQQHFIRYCCFATIRALLTRADEERLATGDTRAAGTP